MEIELNQFLLGEMRIKQRPGPRTVTAFVNRRLSRYSPGRTTTVSPGRAAATAAAMVLNSPAPPGSGRRWGSRALPGVPRPSVRGPAEGGKTFVKIAGLDYQPQSDSSKNCQCFALAKTFHMGGTPEVPKIQQKQNVLN